MTWALNWGLAYGNSLHGIANYIVIFIYMVILDLPNDTWILSQKNGYHKFPKPIVQRRHRRDLYSHLEHIIDKSV